MDHKKRFGNGIFKLLKCHDNQCSYQGIPQTPFHLPKISKKGKINLFSPSSTPLYFSHPLFPPLLSLISCCNFFIL